MDRRLVALAVGAFVVAAEGTLVVGLLPEIRRDLGVSLAAAGQGVTAFAAAYAVGGPLLAFVLRRVATTRVLVGALTLFVMSNTVTGLAPNLPFLLTGRVLAGAAAAMFTPAASVAATALVVAARRGRALSVVVSGGAAGVAFGVPAGTWIGAWSSWRVAFLLLAGLALIVTVSSLLLLTSEESAGRRDSSARIWESGALRVLLVTFCWALGSFAFFTYVSLVLGRAAGVSGGLLAIFLLLYGVCGIGGSFAAGWLTDRVGARTALTFALPTTALSLIGLGWMSAGRGGGVPALAVCALLFALYAVGTWSVNPPQQHRLLALADDQRATLALNASALYSGVALGGIVGGIVIRTGHGAATICWIAACIEIATLILLRLPDRLGDRKTGCLHRGVAEGAAVHRRQARTAHERG